MAGGKLSPRQKMINLMYLVFIAMLAMNMSKEVLSAFGFMNEELTESIRTTSFKNNESYSNLNIKAQDQKEKYGPLKIKSDQIKSLSNGKDVALCCYESLKNEDEWCHRTMLAEYVNNLLGYKLITEFSEKPKSQYIQLSLM